MPPGLQPRTFFIVGRGRSGTTLLSRMLSAHPSAVVAPEGFFLMNLSAKYGRGRWSHARIDAFCNDLLAENRMKDWRLDIDALSARLKSISRSLTFARAATEVYANHAVTAGRPGAAIVGDKNPHYALLIPRIRSLLPEARFIHLVRDYRDNVASFMDAPFDLADPEALAGRWRLFNAAILASRDEAPEFFLQVSYRDLVRDPRGQLQRVCAFLEIPFDEAMLDFHERASSERLPGWHRNLARPLSDASLDRWRTSLASPTVANLEDICGGIGEQLGFTRTSSQGRVSRLAILRGWLLASFSVGLETVLFRAPTRTRIAVLNLYRETLGLP